MFRASTLLSIGFRRSATFTVLRPTACPTLRFQQRWFGNSDEGRPIPDLRSKIHEQSRDPKVHILDKIQTQVELVLQLCSSPVREDREEALGRGEALWKTLQPSHHLSAQIPAPSRASVRIILSESMLECAKSMRDSEQTKLWEKRFRDKAVAINPRDFDMPNSDPMSLFQFSSEGYGSSGVTSTGAVIGGGGESATKKQSQNDQVNKAPQQQQQRPARRSQQYNPLDELDDDEDFEDDSNEGGLDSYVKGKLKSEGVDRRSLLQERKAFEAEEEDRKRTASESEPTNGKTVQSSFAENPNDDEKTKEAKAKMRKLFGDENSTMNQHKRSVFNDHPMFSRNKPIKWGEAVGPRYT